MNTDVESHWVDADGVRWRQPDVQAECNGVSRGAGSPKLSTTFLHVIAAAAILLPPRRNAWGG